MIDSIGAQHVKQTVATTVKEQRVQAVDNLDSAALQQAMQQPGSNRAPETVNYTVSVTESAAAACKPTTSNHCLGDKILDSMEKLKSSHDNQVEAINQSLKVENISTQDILLLQLDLAKLHIQEELMAKTASKSTQNIDTLLKAQ